MLDQVTDVRDDHYDNQIFPHGSQDSGRRHRSPSPPPGPLDARPLVAAASRKPSHVQRSSDVGGTQRIQRLFQLALAGSQLFATTMLVIPERGVKPKDAGATARRYNDPPLVCDRSDRPKCATGEFPDALANSGPSD